MIEYRDKEALSRDVELGIKEARRGQAEPPLIQTRGSPRGARPCVSVCLRVCLCVRLCVCLRIRAITIHCDMTHDMTMEMPGIAC